MMGFFVLFVKSTQAATIWRKSEKYSLPKEANAFGNEYFSTKFVN